MKKRSLSTQILLQIGLLGFVGVMFFLFVLFLTVQPKVEIQSGIEVELATKNIANAIQQKLAKAEVLAQSLAKIGERFTGVQSHDAVKLLSILSISKNNNFIAGGGVWFEPYMYSKEKERESFFWARDAQNKYVFVNDYNNENTPAYYKEAWYVPSKYTDKEKVFWSASYIDPYTKVPMVTVSVPMYKDGVFLGVATIDVSLRGINKLLEQETKKFDGYAFIIDADGKFLSFPQHELVVDTNGEYITLDALTQKVQSYGTIKKVIDKTYASTFESVDPLVLKYKEKLLKEVNSIGVKEAAALAFYIVGEQSVENSMKKVKIHKDYLIDDRAEVLIHNFTNTHWSMPVVIPSSYIYRNISSVFINVIAAIIVISLSMFYLSQAYLRRVLLNPIQKLFNELEELSNKDNTRKYLSVDGENELATLALHFNENTQKMYDSMDAKSNFLANMSHELRTPLNSIIGFSGILSKKQTDTEHKKLSHQINTSSKSLLALINDILDLSKIENSNFSITPYAFDAYKEIVESNEQLEGLTATKTLLFTNQISDDLKAVFYGDWDRIHQIILNLVSNAVKFTAENGEILSTYNYANNCLVIRIKDNGIGMSKEVQDRVFNPFEQADGSTTRKYGGTGLGLSITQNLVELMAGTIEIESQEGLGTTFTITIPLQKLESNKLEIKNEQVENKEDTLKGHILVVEDNKTNQMLVKMLVEDFGITCDIANDGLEAVELYTPEQHQLVLMDENMPNMNGLESMRILKEKYQEKCTPIIALTANVMEGDEERFLLAGMDAYIAKPIDEDALYNLLKKYLG